MSTLFNLLVLVPVLIGYGLIGSLVLAILKKPITLLALCAFFAGGAAFSFVSMVFYAMIFADESGNLAAGAEVIGMYVVAGLSALLGSLLTIRFMAK